MLNQTEMDIVEELKGRLREAAGDRLQAVIVQGLTPELEAALHESAYQVMWDYDFTPFIALMVFDADNFAAYREKGFSFYRKVAQEGIAL